MPYKDFIFNGYAFTDEGMTGYFTLATDEGIFLDFYKGSDFGMITNCAAVEVDKVVEDNVSA